MLPNNTEELWVVAYHQTTPVGRSILVVLGLDVSTTIRQASDGLISLAHGRRSSQTLSLGLSVKGRAHQDLDVFEQSHPRCGGPQVNRLDGSARLRHLNCLSLFC